MMRSVVVGLIVAMLSMAQAQEKGKIVATQKAGETLRYSLEVDYDVAGATATMTTKMIRKVKKVSAELVDLSIDYEDFKIDVDGNNLTLPYSQIVLSTTPSGEVRELTGGVEGNDNTRTYMVGMFIAPSEELAKDEKWTYESKGNEKAGVPAFKYELTFVGMEKVGSDDVLKFSTKLSEIGASFTVKGTWWISKEGHVVKAETEFDGLLIPAAGTEASGKVRLNLVK